MKIKLVEKNKQIGSEDLLEDLMNVAKTLQKETVTIKEYKEYGQYSYQTLKKRFGSWENSLDEAGLKKSKRPWGGGLVETKIPEKELIEDLKRVREKIDRKSVTIKDYDKHGKFGSSAICKRFGGWNNAKIAAGLEVGRVYNSSEEDYFENIFHVWQTLGRQPKYQEMIQPLSTLHISSYERKFGSWRIALEKFVEYINSLEELPTSKTIVKKKHIKPHTKTVIKKKPLEKPKKRSNRIANLKQRFQVMKRDNFSCQYCGASPAKDSLIELHIDHIVPWSKGGETEVCNLQTLCSSCNLGKSNS
ncbi:HNH endonuclease [Bacteriovoracaceae bacterium]|nr:HNH endonuclease [Bacteriovoracaceae bacterium]